MTGQQHVERALVEIGVLGAGQTAPGTMADLALTVSRRMFNAWAAERLTILSILRTTRTLTSGTRDYTIGSGGTINIVRPLWIDHATIILDNAATDPLELPIRVYTETEWALLGLKTYDAATIEGIYYDKAFSSAERATISTWPTINISTATLVLYTPLATVGFTSLAEDLVFAPAYEEAIHYNLALRLCRPFGRPKDPELVRDAEDSLRTVKLANVRMADLVALSPWTTGVYDIDTDGFR